MDDLFKLLLSDRSKVLFSMSNLFRLILSDSSINLKLVFIMNKRFLKIVIEVLKAILYALSGFFGVNALM